MIAVPPARATAPRSLESGTPGRMFGYVRRDYLGPATAAAHAAPAPQAFLVEVTTPAAEIPPHFHRVDEFQVVVAGGGSLGTHALAPVTAHFAEAYTPYGPIRVGPDGLTFFTLRPAPDAGALYMPGARGEMIRKARRSVAGAAALAGAAPAPEGVTPLIAPHADGLAAWLVRAPAGAVTTPVPGGVATGRYYVVAAGDVEVAGEALPRWSCVWVGPGDGPPALVAGRTGAGVVVLQFPLTG